MAASGRARRNNDATSAAAPSSTPATTTSNSTESPKPDPVQPPQAAPAPDPKKTEPKNAQIAGAAATPAPDAKKEEVKNDAAASASDVKQSAEPTASAKDAKRSHTHRIIATTAEALFKLYLTNQGSGLLQQFQNFLSSATKHTNAKENEAHCKKYTDRLKAIDDPNSHDNLVDFQLELCKQAESLAKNTLFNTSTCTMVFMALNNYLNYQSTLRKDDPYIVSYCEAKQHRIESIKRSLAEKIQLNSESLHNGHCTTLSEEELDNYRRQLVYLGENGPSGPLSEAKEIERLFPKRMYYYPTDIKRQTNEPPVNPFLPLVVHKNLILNFLFENQKSISYCRNMIEKYEKVTMATAGFSYDNPDAKAATQPQSPAVGSGVSAIGVFGQQTAASAAAATAAAAPVNPAAAPAAPAMR